MSDVKVDTKNGDSIPKGVQIKVGALWGDVTISVDDTADPAVVIQYAADYLKTMDAGDRVKQQHHLLSPAADTVSSDAKSGGTPATASVVDDKTTSSGLLLTKKEARSAFLIYFPISRFCATYYDFVTAHHLKAHSLCKERMTVRYVKWRDESVSDQIPSTCTALEGVAIVALSPDHKAVVSVVDGRQKHKLVSGYFEPNEKLLDAVRRELREETGLLVDETRGYQHVGGFKSTWSRWPGFNDDCTVVCVTVKTSDLKFSGTGWPQFERENIDAAEISQVNWIPLSTWVSLYAQMQVGNVVGKAQDMEIILKRTLHLLKDGTSPGASVATSSVVSQNATVAPLGYCAFAAFMIHKVLVGHTSVIHSVPSSSFCYW